MKNTKSIGIAIIAALSLMGSRGHADVENDDLQEQMVEVPVLKVFVPFSGYDNNDTIQLVIQGEFPNPCFTLAKSVVKVSGKTIEAHQMAWVRRDGNCGSGDLIDAPVPFTSEVKVGRLKAANYTVNYQSESGTTLRPFTVSVAKKISVDDFTYAAVSGVSVIDSLPEGTEVKAQLSGVLTSTCARLVEPIEKKVIGDVIVLLPEQVFDLGRDCRPAKIPFNQEVNLGALKPDSYLLHVRSMVGKAVFKAFEVYTN